MILEYFSDHNYYNRTKANQFYHIFFFTEFMSLLMHSNFQLDILYISIVCIFFNITFYVLLFLMIINDIIFDLGYKKLEL